VARAYRARDSRWKALAPFRRRVLHLSVVISRLQGWYLKQRATIYTVGWRVSFTSNFFLIWSSFLLLHFLLFFSSLLDWLFFDIFIPHYLISLNSYIIFSFFYHAFTTLSRSRPHHISGHGLGRMIRVTEIN